VLTQHLRATGRVEQHYACDDCGLRLFGGDRMQFHKYYEPIDNALAPTVWIGLVNGKAILLCHTLREAAAILVERRFQDLDMFRYVPAACLTAEENTVREQDLFRYQLRTAQNMVRVTGLDAALDAAQARIDDLTREVASAHERGMKDLRACMASVIHEATKLAEDSPYERGIAEGQLPRDVDAEEGDLWVLRGPDHGDGPLLSAEHRDGFVHYVPAARLAAEAKAHEVTLTAQLVADRDVARLRDKLEHATKTVASPLNPPCKNCGAALVAGRCPDSRALTMDEAPTGEWACGNEIYEPAAAAAPAPASTTVPNMGVWLIDEGRWWVSVAALSPVHARALADTLTRTGRLSEARPLAEKHGADGAQL
jgi:hypothetical protein